MTSAGNQPPRYRYRIYASLTAPWAVTIRDAYQRAYFDTWEEARSFVWHMLYRDQLGRQAIPRGA